MKAASFLLLSTFYFLLVTIPALAYPGEQEKEPAKVPEIEKWKVSDVTPPKYNYQVPRLSKTGTALKPNDLRQPVMECIFYEDLAHPGEFGGIYRAKNEKDEWVIFAKCWGMKKVDGQWEQDIDKDGNGVPDDNGHLNFAILAHDGNWYVGAEGETKFAWATVWHDPDTRDYVEGIRYCIAGKDDDDPSGLFLYTGRVMMFAPEPEPPDEDEPEDLPESEEKK